MVARLVGIMAVLQQGSWSFMQVASNTTLWQQCNLQGRKQDLHQQCSSCTALGMGGSIRVTLPSSLPTRFGFPLLHLVLQRRRHASLQNICCVCNAVCGSISTQWGRSYTSMHIQCNTQNIYWASPSLHLTAIKNTKTLQFCIKGH